MELIDVVPDPNYPEKIAIRRAPDSQILFGEISDVDELVYFLSSCRKLNNTMNEFQLREYIPPVSTLDGMKYEGSRETVVRAKDILNSKIEVKRRKSNYQEAVLMR